MLAYSPVVSSAACLLCCLSQLPLALSLSCVSHVFLPPSLCVVQVMNELDEKQRAAFLQFVTGTSRVPLGGFKFLVGMRGPQKFSIQRYAQHVAQPAEALHVHPGILSVCPPPSVCLSLSLSVCRHHGEEKNRAHPTYSALVTPVDRASTLPVVVMRKFVLGVCKYLPRTNPASQLYRMHIHVGIRRAVCTYTPVFLCSFASGPTCVYEGKVKTSIQTSLETGLRTPVRSISVGPCRFSSVTCSPFFALYVQLHRDFNSFLGCIQRYL